MLLVDLIITARIDYWIFVQDFWKGEFGDIWYPWSFPRQIGCTKVAGTESSWESTNSPTKSCNTDKPVSRRSLYKINSKEVLTTYINPINKFTSHTSFCSSLSQTNKNCLTPCGEVILDQLWFPLPVITQKYKLYARSLSQNILEMRSFPFAG